LKLKILTNNKKKKVGFVVAWTPYCMVSVMSLMLGHGAVSSLGSFLPSMVAKV